MLSCTDAVPLNPVARASSVRTLRRAGPALQRTQPLRFGRGPAMLGQGCQKGLQYATEQTRDSVADPAWHMQTLLLSVTDAESRLKAPQPVQTAHQWEALPGLAVGSEGEITSSGAAGAPHSGPASA